MLLYLQVLIEEISDDKARGPFQKPLEAACSTARAPTAPTSAPVPTTSSKEATRDDDTIPLAPSAPAPQVGKYRCAHQCSCGQMQAAVSICGSHPAGGHMGWALQICTVGPQ